MAPIGYEAGNELRNPSGFRSECPRAAKKRFGKVRKYQFCGQLTESIPVAHPHLSVHYPYNTKRCFFQLSPEYIVNSKTLINFLL